MATTKDSAAQRVADIAGKWRTDESFEEEVDRLRQARTEDREVEDWLRG